MPAPTRKKGKRVDVRTVHRVLSFGAVLLLLYIGITGTAIQGLDLLALGGNEPETTPTMQSINEGKFGNEDFSAVLQSDWGAGALPDHLDVVGALRRALASFHRTRPTVKPAYVELRVIAQRPLVQVGYVAPAKPDPHQMAPQIAVAAFDPSTGAPVDALAPRSAVPEPSTRQSLKEWHRFWARRDVPGVYVEFASGLAMSVLIYTGLVMYFRLLRQRRKMGRNQLFWMAGETMRSLHRIVSVVAAVLLVLVAASGTWLGFESTWHTFVTRLPPAAPTSLGDVQAERIALAALASFRAGEPSTPIRTIRARIYAGHEQGVIVTADAITRQHVFDTASGKEVGLSEPYYPPSGFPFGMDVHEWVKHFHSGYLFGLPARFLDFLAGLALVFLSVSGLVMYVDMYRRRARSGRSELFWK